MPNVPDGHFAEATAIWAVCVVLFVLIVGLRRAWIERAKTLKMAARTGANAAADLSGEGSEGGAP